MKPRSINIFLLDGDPNRMRVAQISMSMIEAIAFPTQSASPGSGSVGARLSYHNSNEAGRDARGFWTDTVVLISKDENRTKSHARHVGSCLIRGVDSEQALHHGAGLRGGKVSHHQLLAILG